MFNKFPKKLSFLLLSGLTMMLALTACKKESVDHGPNPTESVTTETADKLTKSTFKLNTIITITLYDHHDVSIIDECFSLCDEYENLLSRTKTSSEIYRLNQTYNTPFEVSDDTLELLRTGLEYSKLSSGSFDISVEPLTSLWNFSSSNPHVPDSIKINDAISHIGYDNVKISGNSVTLTKENMGIDLGAIAKGFIADKLKEHLLKRGVKSAIIDLGGNILCVGEKPSGEPFTIGIQKPYEHRNDTIAVMEINDKSVVSSGIYERYFVEDGVSYHHILNPATGFPYDNGLTSVTIISNKSVDGDALSTTCFSLGLEKGLELINNLDDTNAVFITSDGSLHYSENFFSNINVLEVTE